jgi:hypothetical protein
MSQGYGTTGGMTPDQMFSYFLGGTLPQVNQQVAGQNTQQQAVGQLRASNQLVNPSAGTKTLNPNYNGGLGGQPKYINNPIQGLNALNTSQMQQNYGPEQMQGAGVASLDQMLNQMLNPNYYSSQSAATTGANSGVGAAQAGINAVGLGGLSPGEEAATERSLNQSLAGTGNLGNNNPTNTIANALNFGGAFNNKLGLYQSALGGLNSATGSASGSANSASGNAGFSPTGTANQFGVGQFQTMTPSSGVPAMNSANALASSLFGSSVSGNSAAQGYGTQLANAGSPLSYANSVGQNVDNG